MRVDPWSKQELLFTIRDCHSLVAYVDNHLQWNMDHSNCMGWPKKFWVIESLSYELCSSVFQFLANLSKICEIFLACEKKTMMLCLLHKNVNTSSRRKGNLMALTAVYEFELWLKVQDMPSKLSSPRQRPWSLAWIKQVFQLSEVELTRFHCTINVSGRSAETDFRPIFFTFSVVF